MLVHQRVERVGILPAARIRLDVGGVGERSFGRGFDEGFLTEQAEFPRGVALIKFNYVLDALD